jgi:hypothetical protein
MSLQAMMRYIANEFGEATDEVYRNKDCADLLKFTACSGIRRQQPPVSGAAEEW